MNTLERLDTDLKAAMIERNEDKVALIRMLKSALKNAEISAGHPLEEAEVLAILEKQAKQRRDSIDQFKAGGREDLAAKEAAELSLLDTYLPEKLSLEELEVLVEQAIQDLAATSAADMGKVIQAVMGKASGGADGKTVSTMVREKLTR